jgi:hypothetical protein
VVSVCLFEPDSPTSLILFLNLPID